MLDFQAAYYCSAITKNIFYLGIYRRIHNGIWNRKITAGIKLRRIFVETYLILNPSLVSTNCSIVVIDKMLFIPTLYSISFSYRKI